MFDLRRKNTRKKSEFHYQRFASDLEYITPPQNARESSFGTPFGKIRKNLENRENSGGGQGLNWGGTKCPKIFLGGAILSHPPPTAEVFFNGRKVELSGFICFPYIRFQN